MKVSDAMSRTRRGVYAALVATRRVEYEATQVALSKFIEACCVVAPLADFMLAQVVWSISRELESTLAQGAGIKTESNIQVDLETDHGVNP